MYYRFIVIFLLFLSTLAKAQNSELWLLDLNGWNDKLLIDWTSNPPIFSMKDDIVPHNSWTPNITVSDTCGNIQFYSDLFCIMDRNLSDTLLADSITGVLSGYKESGGVIKMPNSDSIYLIIRTNHGQLSNVNGSFIPFALDSSISYALWSYNSITHRGELLSKQNKFFDFYSDQLTIVKHGNELDYWLVGREIDGDILVWSIDSSGLEANPTIFSGSPIRTDKSQKYPNSEFYCSPSGKYLFYTHHDLNQYYLCIGEFDRTKGSFKEKKKITIPEFDFNTLNTQEIRSFVYIEECSSLYFVVKSQHSRLFKYRFDNFFNIIDSAVLYLSSDYANNIRNEILLDQMKVFKNKIYFSNDTYRNSIYEDSVMLKMSVLELPIDCGKDEVFHLLGFETGGLRYKSNNPSGKLPTSIGGNYNDEKTIVVENFCLGDTSIFKSYNAGCNPFVEWEIFEENETVGKVFTNENLSYQFQSPGLHKIEYRTTTDTIVKYVNIATRLEGLNTTDTFICENETLLIGNSGINYYSANVIWNTGEKEISIQIEEEGTYVQTIYNTCNSISNSWEVHFLPNKVNTISDSVINSCNQNLLEITIPEGEWSFEWFDSNNQLTRVFEESGSYDFSLYNQCFDTTFTYEVNFESDDFINQINIFTPNGDGYNDLFKPYSENINPEGFLLTIYNRWGQRIFETKDPDVYWDAQDVSSGDYFYSISLVQCDKQKTVKGNVKVVK